MARDRGYDSEWHFDRKVPIGIIMAIVLQTLGMVVVGTAWKADVDNRILQLERSDADRKPQEARLIRLEERLNSALSILNDINRKMEHASNRPLTVPQ